MNTKKIIKYILNKENYSATIENYTKIKGIFIGE